MSEESGWLLSLDGEWFPCKVRYFSDGPIWIEGAAQNIVGGMSGSPILADDGTVIGVLATSNHIDGGESRQGGPNP